MWKKIRKILAMVALMMIPMAGAVHPVMSPHNPNLLPSGAWVSMYADEFHIPASLTHYNDCYRWSCAGGWNGELERYVSPAVTVSNGKLDLQATKCSVTAHNIHYAYCSGMVTTADKFSFLYGYAEARVLLPKGQGLWPAFWMLAQNGQSTTELDVMEVLGNDPSTIHVGSHWKTASGQHKHNGKAIKAADLSAGYHTVAVDWEADHMTFYEDGNVLWSTTDNAAIPSTPMYLIFNLAVGGNWPGKPSASTPFPSDFLVDWVHVYQHASGGGNPTPTPIVPTPTPSGCHA